MVNGSLFFSVHVHLCLNLIWQIYSRFNLYFSAKRYTIKWRGRFRAEKRLLEFLERKDAEGKSYTAQDAQAWAQVLNAEERLDGDGKAPFTADNVKVCLKIWYRNKISSSTIGSALNVAAEKYCYPGSIMIDLLKGIHSFICVNLFYTSLSS